MAAADTSQTFDYVIIGAGSAGCVLANRLSADGKHTVCVLEAGGKDSHPFVHIPAGFMKTLVNPQVNWLYSAEPSEWTGGRRIAAPRGKTLGGSSSINGHIYNRGQRADYDGWAQRGNRGWGYADILPYFKRTERKEGEGDGTFRGKEGSFAVTDTPWKHELCEAFIEGAAGMGIPRNPDYNGKSQDGVGYFQRAIYKGRRMSAARAFLHPAMKRPNVQVITHAHATQILLEGKKATGVEYDQGGQRKQVKARREVILSGGVVNSPQLLQLSGIGDPAHLGRIGVEVRHALPGVGKNLRDHYAVRIVARVKNTWTINERSRGIGLMGEAFKYFTGQASILGLCPSLVHCFWKSHDAVQGNDLQMTFTPASYKEGVQSQLDDFPGVTCAPWQQRPESHGHLLAKSADPFEAPEIQPNYLSDEMDRQVLLGGMRLARKLLQTPPMMKYYEREEFPGQEAHTDDELLAFAKERGTTTFHLMGTCRMAPQTDPTAVVDDQLRVYGIEGLRVADASIMPMMLSANLNAGTLMIGEKAADMILGKTAPEAVILPEAA